MERNFKNDCELVNSNMNKRGFYTHYAQVFDKGTDVGLTSMLISGLFGFKRKPKLTDFDGVTFILELTKDWNSGIKIHIRNYDGKFLIKTSFRSDSYKTPENELVAMEVEKTFKEEFFNIGYELK